MRIKLDRWTGLATRAACTGLLLLAASWTLAEARAEEEDVVYATPLARASANRCDPVPDGCPCPEACLPSPLFRLPCIDACVDGFEKAKADACLRLGAGAYHWFNLNSSSGNATYGYPNGGEGTYFFYLTGDVECDACALGLPKIGAHVEARFRDDTNFRNWFSGPVWVYEAYAWADIHRYGRIKAGAVWKRFGLDWDGSFWGNVPYYDGYKLDTDWGLSWEHEWNAQGRLSVPSYVQFFFAENRVNGSLRGADPESSKLFDERTTGNVRLVPTYHFTKNTSLALGLSGYVGNVKAKDAAQKDDTESGFAADLTLAHCGFKAYGEVAKAGGRRNESHYVTGGPSDDLTSVLVGAEYTYGPFRGRATWSHGDYSNPGGDQDLLVIGLDTTLTSWLTFIIEYVNWDVQRTGGASTSFEEGWQFVLNWHI